MLKKKLKAASALLVTASLLLTGCASSQETSGTSATTAVSSTASSASSAAVTTSLPQIDMSKWSYNQDSDVWYQLGIQYAEDSPDENYDTLAVFVPGKYFSGQENSDGTYTCSLSSDGTVAGFTAQTAPIVLPVNTPGYAAQEELTEYTDVSDYTDDGFVYVHIACRGRDAGAPYGVTDLKAGIRYLRYNEGVIAGDMDRIFSFGMSGGGAQSALLGATGDSTLYDPYLKEVGAVQGVSDSVAGSMCWCPITSLDSGDAAYEWNLGSTRSGLSDDEQKISDALADSYPDYINQLGLTDEDGNTLTLEASSDGNYQAGTYYDYIKTTIETSLENFISDTEWPYDASSSGSDNGAGGPGGGGAPSGEAPSGEKPSGNPPSGAAPDANTGSTASDSGIAASMNASGQNDNITRNENASQSSLDLSGTYETAQDYIDALNADGDWVTYDSSTGSVSITSVSDFVKVLKTASKNIGAFDELDRGQGENVLFGYGDGNGAHFDSTLEGILKDLGNSYYDDFEEDLSKTDSVGNKVSTRLEMYSPLSYLVDGQPDYGKSTVAKYWRIRTGINQSDTALCTEVNLALALESNSQVESVDFATVWGLGHTMAERTGSATDNFTSWVTDCVK